MAGLISSSSVDIKFFLDEPNTVVLVITDTQAVYDDALEVSINNNPAVWRVLWVKNPSDLDADLKTCFWSSGVTEAVVMSLDTGLDRQVKARYAQGELSGAFAIFEAFSQG